jgi:hypothetical protein
MTQQTTPPEIFDALVQRLLALGTDQEIVIKRARGMIGGWEKFSENSTDERGHETCRDWMDAEVCELLDKAMFARYGVPYAPYPKNITTANQKARRALNALFDELNRRERT